MSAVAGTTASTRVTGSRSSSSSTASACAANAAANGSSCSCRIESPAAARWPPKRSRCAAHAARPAWRSNDPIERPEPFQPSPLAGDQHDGAREALDQPRGDDADHALVPAPRPRRRRRGAPRRSAGHASTVATASRRIRSSTAWRSRFSVLELVAPAGRPRAASSREDQVERDVGSPEPSGGVDARREPEARPRSRRRPPGRRARDAHQRAQSGLRACARAPRRPGRGERAVLVDERHDVGDRGERDEVERGGRAAGWSGAEQRLGELVHDARAAELGERVVRRARRDDRAVGQRLARPVVVGDDHVDAEPRARAPPPRRR